MFLSSLSLGPRWICVALSLTRANQLCNACLVTTCGLGWDIICWIISVKNIALEHWLWKCEKQRKATNATTFLPIHFPTQFYRAYGDWRQNNWPLWMVSCLSSFYRYCCTPVFLQRRLCVTISSYGKLLCLLGVRLELFYPSVYSSYYYIRQLNVTIYPVNKKQRYFLLGEYISSASWNIKKAHNETNKMLSEKGSLILPDLLYWMWWK